jgi:hypothetical protein
MVHASKVVEVVRRQNRFAFKLSNPIRRQSRYGVKGDTMKRKRCNMKEGLILELQWERNINAWEEEDESSENRESMQCVHKGKDRNRNY